MKTESRKRHHRGFTLIEAMVAMIVVAFGLVSLVGLQGVLSRTADSSKQRTEAVRLAQEKLECLRAYTQIPSSATTAASRNCMGALLAADTWTGMATVASDPLNPLTSTYSNTSYARSWTIGGATTDPFRTVNVLVTWTDRAGVSQSFTANSVISQSNPDDEGALGFPLPQNTNLKRPKNRNINVPVPALDLGNGKSVYQINATLAVIFSNASGYVIEKCNTTVTALTYGTVAAGCVTYDAYIVAGYVSGESTTALATPTGINTDGVTGWDGSGGKAISCGFGVATDQNNTATLITNFKYYLCVIPVASGSSWSGRIRLSGMTTGNSNRNWLVCRIEYPASNRETNNQRNFQPYASVAESLDSQNYYIASSSSGTCPTLTTTTGNGPTLQSISIATVVQQDCRTTASPSLTSTTCPTTFTGP